MQFVQPPQSLAAGGGEGRLLLLSDKQEPISRQESVEKSIGAKIHAAHYPKIDPLTTRCYRRDDQDGMKYLVKHPSRLPLQCLSVRALALNCSTSNGHDDDYGNNTTIRLKAVELPVILMNIWSSASP